MTRKKKIVLTGPLWNEFDALRAGFRQVLTEWVAGLDPADLQTLAIATACALEVHISPKEIAEAVGTSRTTAIRWARRENIPKAPGYRKCAAETLIELLKQPIVPVGQAAVVAATEISPSRKPGTPKPSAKAAYVV